MGVTALSLRNPTPAIAATLSRFVNVIAFTDERLWRS